MTTFAINMNKEEQIKFCSKFHCITDDIAKIFKATSLDHLSSPYCKDIKTGSDVAKYTEKEAYELVWGSVTTGDWNDIFPGLLEELLIRRDKEPELFNA